MYEDRGRGRRGPGGPGGPGGRRKFIARRKVCGFCTEKIRTADYKDIKRLQRYVSERGKILPRRRGKILPRRRTGTCARHQRGLTVAIKRARHMALLPYAAAHTRN